MKATLYVLPAVVVGIIAYGFVRGVSVFDCFVEGAKKGFELILNLLPVLMGLMLAVSVFRISGAAGILQNVLSPIASALGIPEEVIPLCILSPISGSGSLSMFENILSSYGADSAAGRIASVIAGSTETTFYAATVYLGAVNIKKSGAVIPCALIGDAVSFFTAAITVKYFFG